MDMNGLKIGLEGEIETEVTRRDTADKYGSGSVKVLATPHVTTLIDQAAMSAVYSYLPFGCVTVGTKLNIEHLRALHLQV